jgi:hypothetical protein
LTSARVAVIVRGHMRRRGGIRHLALAAALAAALGSTPGEAANPPPLTLRYDGYWRAFRILSLETRSVTDDADYRLEVKMQTEGLIDLIASWHWRTLSVGAVQDGLFVPRRVETEGRFRSRAYRGTMDYLPSGDLEVVTEPAAVLQGYEPVPEALRRATVDPQTATLALLRRIANGEACTGTERIFDGRLRYDLDFTDLGTETVARARATLYGGPTRVCEALVRLLAGLPRDPAERRRFEARTTLRYWLAPVLEGGAPVPVRLDFSGARGTLNLYLIEASAR